MRFTKRAFNHISYPPTLHHLHPAPPPPPTPSEISATWHKVLSPEKVAGKAFILDGGYDLGVQCIYHILLAEEVEIESNIIFFFFVLKRLFRENSHSKISLI